MNKQNREGIGKMPPAPKSEFVNGSPINSAVSQGGFTREKGGNLRDHDGCKAGPGIKATTHYDGDYGISGAGSGMASGGPSPNNLQQQVLKPSGGAPVGPSAGRVGMLGPVKGIR